MKANEWLTFAAKLERVDINPCVSVPNSISTTFKMRGFIPVELKLKDSHHIANLVPQGGGKYRLYINGPMLSATGWKVGGMVGISLRYDPKPRIEPTNESLVMQMAKHPEAAKLFNKLSASRKKEINRYLNNLKSIDAVERNVKKLINALEGDATHMLIRK
jgi:hypothetical protein